VFKVLNKPNDGVTNMSDGPPLAAADIQRLEKFCRVEQWSADTQNGVFQISENAAYLHGMTDNFCGMIKLISSYNHEDHQNILELFEAISKLSSRFSYATSIQTNDGTTQPVFCVGQSELDRNAKGTIGGIFIFPKFPVEKQHKYRQ
jgi:hypothetical protein